LPDNETNSFQKIPKSELITINIGQVLTVGPNIEIPNPVGLSFPIQIQAADKPEPYEGRFEFVSERLEAGASVSIVKNTIKKTEGFTSIPNGVHLYSVSVSPYKYGLVQVEAITVDLTPYD
jgi:hypothetical protein